jgi:hypothetical protein
MRDKGLVPARGALRFGNRDPRYHGASPPWRRKEAASRGRVGYSSKKGPLHGLSASHSQVRPTGRCNHHRSTPASILPPRTSKCSVDMADWRNSQHGPLSMALTALHNVSTMSRPYNGMDTIRARIGKPDGSDRAHSETWLARWDCRKWHFANLSRSGPPWASNANEVG